MAPRNGLTPRLRWYVDAIDVAAGDRILEIGCGTGHAACAMALAASPGLVTAIDRSPSAITSARANAAKTGVGVAFVQSTLAGFDGGPFDVIVACRVNVFWTGAAAEELHAVRRLLAPGGRLCICLQPPSATKLDGEITAVRGNLAAAGFDVVAARRDDGVPATCLTARLAGCAGRLRG
jgi:protein-L-isoaspartate O-methyltransferase